MPVRHRILAVTAFGALFLGATTFGLTTSKPTASPAAAAARPGAAAGVVRAAGAQSLDAMIANLKVRAETHPRDYVSLSTLGLAYVQQASLSADSRLYPVAESVLRKSLAVNQADNFLAYGGLAALANARHDFANGKLFAERGLAIDALSPVLLGALGDAETQLGNYEAAFSAIQRMIDRSPDTTSLARASYAWELRGDVGRARALMQRALDAAPDAAARAFAHVHLGELAFDNGDASGALAQYLLALGESPTSAPALAGKARTEAALGQTLTAVDDYTALVQRIPDPSYIIEFGELLESVGRTEEASQQFEVVAAISKLTRGNGVAPDAASLLFLADHGDTVRALSETEDAVAARPFLAMQDAHAWVLHRSGRDREALAASNRSLATGFRSAAFRFHRGMIELALGDSGAAEADLSMALAINPAFNPLHANVAREALERLRTSPAPSTTTTGASAQGQGAG